MPTSQEIGQRIEQAIADAADDQLPHPRKTQAAAIMGVTEDTLARYIRGETDPSALQIWRLAAATGKPFSWFAAGDTSASDRIAEVAEAAGDEVEAISRRLTRLLAELAEARAQVVTNDAEHRAVERADRYREAATGEHAGDIAANDR